MNPLIVPYHQDYNEAIRRLEQSIVQGKSIQLEMIKTHFLDRAYPFKKYYACVALDNTGTPIATSIAAKTNLQVNDEIFDAGIGYEVKVHPGHHNKGIGRKMAIQLYKYFFRPEGLHKNFTTLKTSNIPIVKLLSKTVKKIWLYDFVYLTIPAKTRTGNISISESKQQVFSVSLFNREELSPSYYTDTCHELGFFHTYKMYRLKITGVSFLYRMGMGLLKKINPEKYTCLPKINEPFSTAVLYNHHSGNISHINEVLDQLEYNGIDYLMVCCRKNDCIYRVLKKYSINTYGYYILSDFPLTKKDRVTIDARCL